MRATLPSFPIESDGPLSVDVRRFGMASFRGLVAHVKDVPYGRPESASLLAVLTENKGTCSSKHRLLAAVALECGHPVIRLAIGIYSMCESNTPGVGTVLASHGLAAIPEAHCYLVANGTRFDLTGLAGGATSPFDVLLDEHFVDPKDLPAYKVRVHRDALAVWARRNGMAVEKAWAIREACITALASNCSPSPCLPVPPGRRPSARR